MDKSQIRPWAKAWLADMRRRAKLTQEQAAQGARVGIGVVRSVEQTGSPPDLLHFLRLVMAYGAEGELVNQIRAWRAENGQATAAAAITASGTQGATGGDESVERIRDTYKTADTEQAKKRLRKKPRPKKRRA